MSRFNWPVTNPTFSQHFGDNAAWYKANVGQNGHNGDDIAVPTGTAVHASADGTVYFEGSGASLGLMGAIAGICVVLDHGDVFTGYAHMSRTVVNKGQKVKQGQLIGYSGATGLTMGTGEPQPHLHFEFIGKPVNFNNGFAGRLNPANFNVGGTLNTPSKGGDDVIDAKDKTQLRAVMRDIKGWNKANVDAGKYDASEAKAWAGKTWEEYIASAVKESTSFRAKRDVALAYYGKKSANDKSLADAKAAIKAKEAEIAKLKAQPATGGGSIDQATKEAIQRTDTNTSWLKNVFSKIFKVEP